MTEHTDTGEPSRRTILRRTLAGGLALGAGTGRALGADSNAARAQGDQTRQFQALIFAGSFHPGARFEVTSDVLNYTPVVPEGAAAFGDYNSRVIKYTNTNERALFFPANDAEVQRGDVYEFSGSIQPVNPELSDQVWQVTFGPAGGAATTEGGQTTDAGGETTGTADETTETGTETAEETTTEGG